MKLIIYVFLFSLIPNISQAADNQKSYLGIHLPNNFKAFNDHSLWNQPIEDNPAIDEHSSLMIQNLESTVSSIKINSAQWSIPIHVIDSSKTPKYYIRSTRSALCSTVDMNHDQIAEGHDGQGIPIPDQVWADPKEDGHLCLIDLKLQRSWDFSQFKILATGQYQASRIDTWNLAGTGIRKPFEEKHGFWWTNGARGSGFPLIAGLILYHEIESGIQHPNDSNSGIQHALVFASPINRKSSANTNSIELCSPASRSDGWGIGSEYIPEGARLQLNPQFDISHLSPATQVIAKALQKYGMFNGDNSKGLALYAQNMGSENARWNQWDWNLNEIPIKQFRVLKCELHQKKLSSS